MGKANWFPTQFESQLHPNPKAACCAWLCCSQRYLVFEWLCIKHIAGLFLLVLYQVLKDWSKHNKFCALLTPNRSLQLVLGKKKKSWFCFPMFHFQSHLSFHHGLTIILLWHQPEHQTNTHHIAKYYQGDCFSPVLRHQSPALSL